MLSSRGHVLMESFALALPLPRHLGWRELGAANTAGSGGSRDRAEQRAGAGAARPPWTALDPSRVCEQQQVGCSHLVLTAELRLVQCVLLH